MSDYLHADIEALLAGCDHIANAMLECLERPANEDALEILRNCIDSLGLAESIYFGPLAEIDRLGHVLLARVASGFLRMEVHNDSRYVEPLIVRKGVAPPNYSAMANTGCTITKICTSTIDLNGGPSTCDFEDLGAEDPAAGLFSEYEYVVRARHDAGDIRRTATSLRTAVGCLEDSASTAADRKKRLRDLDKGEHPQVRFASVEDDSAEWFLWLISLSHGGSVLVQAVRSDELEPLLVRQGERWNSSLFQIEYSSVPMSGGEYLIVPRVGMRYGEGAE